ncbi:MAG: hypothetical protein IJU76_01740 [Desulfovibrionaceae bacterium]|nr:hypothetical protein [Desulfovibrionaceae bacterium]
MEETITVRLEPGDTERTMRRVKTVRQLFQALDIAEETALVVRDGKLLTPDRSIQPDDVILVRKVASRG